MVIGKELRFIRGALGFVRRRGIGPAKISGILPRVRTIEARIYSFYERNHARFFLILFVECFFHLAGVVEAYVTLWFISHTIAPTWMSAFILESVNRLINVVFKFIPLRIGVDEGGTGKVASLLGLTRTTGVTLAIVRKARDICWTAIVIALIVRRGISLRAST